MSWIAVVPLKQAGRQKSRLSGRMGPPERARLAHELAAHVVGCLAQVSRISTILQLSPDAPTDARCGWRRDAGRGLNAELAALRDEGAMTRLLVIHGDLPLVSASDIEMLLDAALPTGMAIAPDWHGTGTNAIAFAHLRPFAFAFGEASMMKHLRAAGPEMRLVSRLGLAVDIDTPEDLQVARDAGWRWSDRAHATPSARGSAT